MAVIIVYFLAGGAAGTGTAAPGLKGGVTASTKAVTTKAADGGKVISTAFSMITVVRVTVLKVGVASQTPQDTVLHR